MHLVIHQVVELEHVHVAHRHLAVKRIASPAVVKRDLSLALTKAQLGRARIAIGECQVEHPADVGLCCSVKNRACKRHPITQV